MTIQGYGEYPSTEVTASAYGRAVVLQQAGGHLVVVPVRAVDALIEAIRRTRASATHRQARFEITPMNAA